MHFFKTIFSNSSIKVLFLLFHEHSIFYGDDTAGFIDYLDAHEGGIWIWSALLTTLDSCRPTFQLLDTFFHDHFGLDFRRHLPSARYLPSHA